MTEKIKERILEIPAGINCELNNSNLILEGSKGKIQRNFLNPRIRLEKKENKLIISVNSKKQTKKDKMILKTFYAHIKNMLEGIQHSYIAELKICASHFPMTVNSDKNILIIKNFLGEKVPRKAKLYPDVKVDIIGDIIKITGSNKESVGQTAANIEVATKIKKRDRRVFQDGIWIIKKPVLLK